MKNNSWVVLSSIIPHHDHLMKTRQLRKLIFGKHPYNITKNIYFQFRVLYIGLQPFISSFLSTLFPSSSVPSLIFFILPFSSCLSLSLPLWFTLSCFIVPTFVLSFQIFFIYLTKQYIVYSI